MTTTLEPQHNTSFRTVSIYLNDSDAAMGARLIHERSGFTLDLLQIESVPQAFIWVTTYPTSDMGEPHTQEHLLLGKGNKGRAVASHEAMSLAGSSAFTSQWRTCYSFYTSAGAEVFYEEFERRMDALLHPDYDDEEVRREVRNFGVTEDPQNGALGLEEKGSVYNEMVSSMDQPGRRIYRAAAAMVYGPDHPLALNSGGSPEALRLLEPADIRKFHAAHYHLANMGAVVSIPKDMTMESVLERFDALLDRLQQPSPRPLPGEDGSIGEKDLPAPRPAPFGEIRFVEYPHRNDQQPGAVWFVWPADRTLDVTEQTLLGLFLETFAGDPTTNLYKRFIDRRTREIDLGAQSVFADLGEDLGHPVTIGFGDAPVAKMNERDISDLRARVLDELRRVAAWSDGSVELREFNDRVRSRMLQMRRNLSKFVNSPPSFGFRGAGGDWLWHLDLLNKEPSLRKSVTMKHTLERIEQMLAGDRNIWTDRIPQWKLLPAGAVDDRPLPLPWALAAKPNPALIQRDQEERAARIAAEIARLKAKYNLQDDQQTLRRYREEYDAVTAELERRAGRVSPKFIDNPPMTLDDPLVFRNVVIDGRPMVVSTFDNMTSATLGIALRLDGVAPHRLLYLSVLPQLITRVGVIENGTPVSYEAMSERLRKEILSLNADISVNPKTRRVELVLRGAGNDIAEARRAVEWMRLALFHADWRPENLPRIRDLVDQAAGGLRRTMQGAEESWVRSVALAYWRQDSPLILAASSFLTQTHHVHRLRWMLKDASQDRRRSTVEALTRLADAAGAKDSRAALKERLASLAAGPDPLLADAARDLDLTLSDIPDSSLALDWRRLCLEMASDLATGPEKALAELEALRKDLLRAGNARLFLIASSESERALTPVIEEFVRGLEPTPAVAAVGGPAAAGRLIDARLREREPEAARPVFVGLLNPNSQSGVIVNSAPGPGYEDADRDKLLDYLAAALYGGGGAHSIFMKTWGAGLAYSNGIGVNLAQSRITYYAERTPELPQTLRFVISELRNARPDPALVEYAVAQAFAGARSASSYESRGEQMAANLADGLTPEIVARFHAEILKLRSAPDLAEELYRRMPRVYARVLPGMGVKASEIEDAVFFVIGPEKQFEAWEEYLRSVEGPDVKVYRLYPRDFWMEF